MFAVAVLAVAVLAVGVGAVGAVPLGSGVDVLPDALPGDVTVTSAPDGLSDPQTDERPGDVTVTPDTVPPGGGDVTGTAPQGGSEGCLAGAAVADGASGDPGPEPAPTPTIAPPPTGTTSPGGGDCPPIDAVDDEVQTPPAEAVRVDHALNDRVDVPASARPDDPANGTVVVADDGTGAFVYTPDAILAPGDEDRFTYDLCDDAGVVGCDTATVTVRIVSAGDMEPEIVGDVGVAEPPGPTSPSRCQQPHPWDGHANGRIPDAAMAEIGGGHRLQEEAADAFVTMRAAAADDGITIGLTDSYRSFAAQEEVRRRKGHLVQTATPGTSVHGWGKAVDLDVRSSEVRSWLQANSRDFAWVNPPWAQRPGKGFEPWHYEFYGVGVAPDDPACAGLGVALLGGETPSAVPSAPAVAGQASLTPRARPAALGLGAVVALVGAATILVRDVRRSRRVADLPDDGW